MWGLTVCLLLIPIPWFVPIPQFVPIPTPAVAPPSEPSRAEPITRLPVVPIIEWLENDPRCDGVYWYGRDGSGQWWRGKPGETMVPCELPSPGR